MTTAAGAGRKPMRADARRILIVAPGSLTEQWQDVPDTQVYDNGFKIQWEHFIRHVVENEPYKWTLPEGAKGVQLVEAALESWEQRRWVDVPALQTPA